MYLVILEAIQSKFIPFDVSELQQVVLLGLAVFVLAPILFVRILLIVNEESPH